jgi:hypothetical protein
MCLRISPDIWRFDEIESRKSSMDCEERGGGPAEVCSSNYELEKENQATFD